MNHATYEADQKAVRENEAAILAKKPANAKALIVAEFHENDSDLQTDYHNHKTTRRVAIGWRTTARESFKQLRKAAWLFDETAHLGPAADKSVEHRENYSMGAGNYVKDGHSDTSGWCVKSYSLEYGIGDMVEHDRLPSV